MAKKRPTRRSSARSKTTRPTGGPRPRRAAAAQPGAAPQRQMLLVVLVPGRQELEEVVTGLLDIGLHATVLEAKGLAALLRDEMPIYASLLESATTKSVNRVIIAVAAEDLAQAALDYVLDEVAEGALAFTIMIDRMIIAARPGKPRA